MIYVNEYSSWNLLTNNVDIIICLIAIKTISATKNINYKLWLQRLDIQTNNISISISLGFQKFSENSLSACVKHNKL